MRLAGSTLVVLALLFCGASRAQEANDATKNIFAALDSRNIPSRMQGKNLTAAWRVLRADESFDQTVLMQMVGMQQPSKVSPWNGFYYTRGDVLAVGGQIYLIAYSVQPPQSEEERERQKQYLRAMQNGGADIGMEKQKSPLPLEENTSLVLSLVSLEGSKSLNSIRAFDPAKDLLTDAEKIKSETKVMRSISQTNLKQVGLGLMMYVQDYDEKLPPMRAARSAAEVTSLNNNWAESNAPVQSVLAPYTRNTQLFLHPKTGRPYLPNYKISRFILLAIKSPSTTFAFYEDAPDAEGMRNVLFLDGHVKAFSEAEFQKMRKVQGISQSGLPSVAKDKKAVQRKLDAQEKLYEQAVSKENGPGAPPGYFVPAPPAAPPPR